jgi:nucleoid DNA-binding protein
MTKAQLMVTLAEKAGLSKKEVVNFMDILTTWLTTKQKRMVNRFNGFGKLVRVDRKARMEEIQQLEKQIQSRLRKLLNSKFQKQLKMLSCKLID